MYTIIQILFNNLTFLTTILFFGNLFLKIAEKKIGHVRWLLPVLAGIFAGLIGLALMSFFSIRFMSGTNPVIVDFRQLAIMISFYYGGGWSGLISALIIGIYRLFLGEPQHFSSWIGLGNAMLTYAMTAICMRHPRTVSLPVWIRTIIGTLFVYIISITIVGAFESPLLHIMFGVFYIFAGLFAYYIIRYIQKADDTLLLMKEAANHDFLTKLYNPRSFERLFRQVITEAKEEERNFALIILDIDFFKKVNDTYGHLNGDTVLAQIAQLLSSSIRSDDFCARKGGEEFAAVLTPCTPAEAWAIAERIRQHIQEHVFILEEGQQIQVTVSIGVSCYPQIDPEQLFQKADEALYRAKESGRNRVCIAEHKEEAG